MSIWDDPAERLAKWRAQDHDRRCEQRERSYICHCAKRAREKAGKTKLPQIEFAYPTCSGCRQEVDHDGDNFVCPRCHVVWERNAADGDTAQAFTDDYGTDFGGEQFGELLRHLAVTA